MKEEEIEGIQRLLARREILQKSIQKLQFWISVCEKKIPRFSSFMIPPNTAVFADSEKPYSTFAGISPRTGNLIITQESHDAPFDLAVVMGKIAWLQQQ